MEKLVISSYIKIMQEGFVEHNKQESAAQFLLDSVINQEAVDCTTDFNSKKVSNIMNRKDPVPDDIKKASAKEAVIQEVCIYFEKDVINALNPNSKYDVFEKVYSLVEQDTQISSIKKNELLEIYNDKMYGRFLAEVFLYVLSRDNKIKSRAKSVTMRTLYRSSVVTDEMCNDILNDSDVLLFTGTGEITKNVIYKLTTDFKLSSDYDDEGSRRIVAETSVAEIRLTGETSVSNWISRSYMNNFLKAGKVSCTVWLKVLSAEEHNCIVQFLVIGDDLYV